MTCDDFQIAFDQQRAGVTPAIAADDLATHISGCPACTAYVSLSEQVAASMTTALSIAPAAPTVESILARATKERRRLKLFALILPAYVLALLAVMVVVIHGGVHRGHSRLMYAPIVALGLGVAIGGVLYAWRYRLVRRVELSETSAVMSTWRKERVSRLRMVYGGLLLTGGCAIGIQVFKFGFALPHGAPGMSEASSAFMAGLFVFMAIKLRRELKQLP